MSIYVLTFFVLLFLLVLAITAAGIYGTVLSFQKKWYIGLASLVVPGFAVIIGAAKIFGKDLLK